MSLIHCLLEKEIFINKGRQFYISPQAARTLFTPVVTSPLISVANCVDLGLLMLYLNQRLSTQGSQKCFQGVAKIFYNILSKLKKKFQNLKGFASIALQ